MLNSTHFASFLAPLTVGNHSQLEGTPNVYNVSVATTGGVTSVTAEIGFHYNSNKGVDQVAHGILTAFGGPSPSWTAAPSTGYNNALIAKGVIGNIGQRDSGSVGPIGPLIIQEGNIGEMPPTIWKDWRLWLYMPTAGEGLPPTGQGDLYLLQPETDKGSTAFGNPSFTTVPCPFDFPPSNKSRCLFVSFFAFGEGAKPGEAGVVAFYNRYYIV